jgi:hypothetical protein
VRTERKRARNMSVNEETTSPRMTFQLRSERIGNSEVMAESR